MKYVEINEGSNNFSVSNDKPCVLTKYIVIQEYSTAELISTPTTFCRTYYDPVDFYVQSLHDLFRRITTAEICIPNSGLAFVVIVFSDVPRQNQGRGLVDLELVKAPPQ